MDAGLYCVDYGCGSNELSFNQKGVDFVKGESDFSFSNLKHSRQNIQRLSFTESLGKLKI